MTISSVGICIKYIPEFLVYIDAVLVLITIEDLLGGEPSYEELENFLADRWSAIQGLFFDYMHNPASPLTELCYAIAKYLESHEENREKKIAYQFLMPTSGNTSCLKWAEEPQSSFSHK